MLEISEPSASKASRFNTLSGNAEFNDLEIEETENDDGFSLWGIEDDTMFYAQGLKHHSAGKGKSVYVTWNENYLLNFVFKTSNKTGKTTLTKVRISMPVYDQQLEEIADMLILEMNTLLYMRSGRVYYFSSVKSMHKVDWLTGVRCMSSCPLSQFSVIRLVCSSDNKEPEHKKILSLEVYRDIPQLGRCVNDERVLRHCYDISFDLENLFNSDWIDEIYTITSIITDDKNISFLKQIISTANIFGTQEDVIELEIHQEVHIFSISGNIFVLVGANVLESECALTNSQVDDYSIRLLNTYACHIQCIRIDCENNLLIVLLQSGHMDIWYKSNRMFGALFHRQHQISNFLYYDYWSSENIFYFTTPEDVIQLKIITANENGVKTECNVEEIRKSIGGMIACTWVENLQQLICLSFNNIFYRINFTALNKTNQGYTNDNETKYENLHNVYALNKKHVQNLLAKGQIVNELMEQPKQIHQAIEMEFQKQEILSLGSKKEILTKLFQCHLEYHVNKPGLEYFDKDCVQIKTINHQNEHFGAQTIFCLIFISLKNKSNFLYSVFSTTFWYLHISNTEQSLQLHIPYELFSKQLCVIVQIPLKQYVNSILPNYSLNLISFLNHHSQHVCLKFKMCLDVNEKSYLNIFSYKEQTMPLFRNFFHDVETLLMEQSTNCATKNHDQMDCKENSYKLKYRYQMSKNIFQYIMEKLKINTKSLSGHFKVYYLHQYLIAFDYDDLKEILQIYSNYPVAIFYLKLFCIYAGHSCNGVEILDTSLKNIQQIIMNYQNDIEHLYGTLRSVESNDLNSNSMHIENMRNIYLKLRSEFCDIFR